MSWETLNPLIAILPLAGFALTALIGRRGHVALLRYAARATLRYAALPDDDSAAVETAPLIIEPTPGAPPVLEPADVDLAPRYPTEFAVLVLAEPAAPDIVRVRTGRQEQEGQRGAERPRREEGGGQGNETENGEDPAPTSVLPSAPRPRLSRRRPPTALIHLHFAAQAVTSGPHHRGPVAVEHRPGGLVGAEPEDPLEPEGGGPVLLRGEVPGGREPDRQRGAGAIEDGAGRGRDAPSAAATRATAIGQPPGTPVATGRSGEAIAPEG